MTGHVGETGGNVDSAVLAPPCLTDQQRTLVNLLQHGLPLVEDPYAAVAAELGIAEQAVIDTLQALLDARVLTRFGPMFQIERAGGHFSLAAMAVPAERFDEVADIVNAFPQVAHNYERTHHFNMWFVLATETPDACIDVIARLELATGIPVVNMPREREYHVRLYLEA